MLALALPFFAQRTLMRSRSGRALGRPGPGRAVVLTALLLLLAGPALAEEQVPRAHLESTLYDFGIVKTGAKVQHTIPLQNLGATDLVIQDMRFSVPALTVRAPRVIPAGGDAVLTLELDTSGFRGDVQARVILRTNDPHADTLELQVRGRVESAVELLPRPAIFVSAFRWEVEERESAIIIVNRDERPLEILGLRSEGGQFTARLKPVEEGRRYELVVKLRGSGPSGMGLGRITLNTNQGETIAIPVFTLLRDRVYVNPPELDLGQISLEQIEQHPHSLRFKTETLYVYKYRGENFRIQVDASPSFVAIKKTPADGPGAMVNIPRQGRTAIFEIAVAPIREELKLGTLKGTIRIRTNDPEFPEVLVPIRCELSK
jgi:hypothetical protein